jgi:hypothetical protein
MSRIYAFNSNHTLVTHHHFQNFLRTTQNKWNEHHCELQLHFLASCQKVETNWTENCLNNAFYSITIAYFRIEQEMILERENKSLFLKAKELLTTLEKWALYYKFHSTSLYSSLKAVLASSKLPPVNPNFNQTCKMFWTFSSSADAAAIFHQLKSQLYLRILTSALIFILLPPRKALVN